MASVFSDSDIKILKEFINKLKNGVVNSGSRSPIPADIEESCYTPDVYIALIPADGIPALEMVGDSPAAGDTPGYADCEIYQLIHNYPNDPTLALMGIADIRVYNLTRADIPGNQNWITVHKTKDGKWIIPKALGTTLNASIETCIGQGWYTARPQLLPVWTYPNEDAECDGCADESGTASSTVSSSACTRVRTTVTGDLPLLYVYDPRAVSLEIGAHVIIQDLGNDFALPLALITGTGTGVEGRAKLWMVLTGTYPIVEIPHEVYTCCDGVPFLTRTDLYCVEGVKCVGATTSCASPETSGTALPP